MGSISIGTTRVGGNVQLGDVNVGDVNIPPATNPIEYTEVVRLDGSSVNAFATIDRPEVKDYQGGVLLAKAIGVPGTTYVLDGIYKGWYIEILRESIQDSIIKIEEKEYRVGVGNATDTVLPNHNATPGSYTTQSIEFKVGEGAFVEIYIARDNQVPVP